jgi:hypothetical protein
MVVLVLGELVIGGVVGHWEFLEGLEIGNGK